MLTNDGLKVVLLLAPGKHDLYLSTQYNTIERGKARTKVSPSSLLTVTVETGHSYTLSTRHIEGETFAYELKED